MQTILGIRWQIGFVAVSVGAAFALFAGQEGGTKASAGGAAALLPPGLVEVLRKGDVKPVGDFLSKEGVVKARDADGNTALILAALYAGPDCLELLLQQKAEVNAVNKHGATALIRAATDYAKAKLLVAADANVEAQTNLGNTPLILAARRAGNSATVKLLLDKGAKFKTRNKLGVSAMLAAAASGDLESVKLLEAAGADVNDQPAVKDSRALIFAGMRTPLMWAAYNNDLLMMEFLLKNGAKPDLGTAYGTPLTQAAWHDNVEAARLLLANNVQVNVRDFANYTPLHWAASTESPRADLVEMLLNAKANPNAEGGDTIDAFLAAPQTPLLLAQKRGQTAIVAALEKAKAKAPVAAKEAVVPLRRDVPIPLDASAIGARIEPALAALQASAASSHVAFTNHVSKQACFSCHQQNLPMAAVGQIRSRGVSFDHVAAKKLIDRTQTPTMKLDEQDLQPVFHPEPGHGYGYRAFALALDKIPAGTTTDGLVHYLAVIQAPDGRWFNNLPRPPLQTSDVSATALAVLALKQYGWPGRGAEFAAAIDRASKWLWSVQAENNEDAVYQLLGLHWAGVPAAKLADLAGNLKKKKRDDGGWAQLPKLESDAYATGQALYALNIAARCSVDDAVWRGGLRYLLQTQHEDGTWSTVRRAFPFQPTMESGFPHGRDAWISAAATSWAILALAQALPDNLPIAANKPLVVSRPPKKPPQANVEVDFVKHIKPILERSCLECHSGKQARGKFRVESRAEILKVGSNSKTLVVPGDSQKSPLVAYVSGQTIGMEMPPMDRRNRFPELSQGERDLLRAWIDNGAVWPIGITLRVSPKNVEGN